MNVDRRRGEGISERTGQVMQRCACFVLALTTGCREGEGFEATVSRLLSSRKRHWPRHSSLRHKCNLSCQVEYLGQA